MCGIAGIVTFDGAPVDRAVLTRMGAALAHRGPDAEGLYVDAVAAPGVGLVHRRLSIIDLSHAADAPVPNEDGTVLVMLNGEIYNFQALRRALASRHAFRSQGDTEVVTHGYEERGDEIFGALDGMFALALWDSRRRRLVLARDAFGKKPLYYWQDARRFVFGSEIKALLAADVPVGMDESAIGEHLAFGYVPTPRTLFCGIRKVPPASTLVVDAGGAHRPHAYWDLTFPARAERRETSLDDAAADVRTLLTEAVRKRLVADVPLGILLSGGVDSSAVAALAARLSPGRVKTFTVGFEDDSFFDERPHAQRVADHLGTDHHATVVNAEAASLIERLLDHHDEPFGDPSALPTYLVAQEARKHVTVALNGDGGDETFAGYDRFHAALLAERLPAWSRRGLAFAAKALPYGAHYHGLTRRVRRFAEKAALSPEERMFSWTTFFDVPTLVALDGAGVVDRARLLASYVERLGRWPDASALSRLLYLNARTYLLDDLLPKMDRMTMAHGLEARSPMLDRELVEYVAGLPDALKRRGGKGKIVLKRAVRDLVPDAIIHRRKQGFGVPLGHWFRTDLRRMVNDVLLDRPRLGRWLKIETIGALYREHADGRADWGHRLWVLLMLELWLRKHRLG